jgi:hypothetical protein
MPPLPAHLVLATHVALQRPFGAVEVMTREAYAEMPEEAVRGTIARLLSRAEAIRLYAEARRRGA